jgi:hypothetical protein
LIAGSFAGAAWAAVPGMTASVDPPQWPQLPPVALLGLLLAATPALTAPPLPRVRSIRTAASRTPVEAAA